MATLISYYTSDGCVGRCDAKCYQARREVCTCICGGANHGVGRTQAMANTERMAREWIERYVDEHPGSAAQLPLRLSQLPEEGR